MLDTNDIALLLIKNRYKDIKEFYINKEVGDVYDFTPHSIRYTCLKYCLSAVSIPLSLVISGVKTITCGGLTLAWLNFPKIFLQKMNQGVSKKILHGLPEEDNEQAITKIVKQVLEKYEEQPELVVQSEPSLISKVTAKLSEYIPGFSKFMNFWNHGGINYQEEVQKKQLLVDFIYKKIVSEAYNVGKKGEKLEINDVQKLFPEINFEAKVELVNIENTEKVIIEDDPKDSVACEQPFLSNNSEKINFNPLVNLIILKALHDGIQQEILKVYLEHCLVEYMYNNNIPTISYSEQPYPLLGNNYYPLPIDCY